VFAQALNNVSPRFTVNLRAMWEAANNRWNQWVLNYSQARQLDLLRNIGFESPSWEDLGYVLSGLVVAAALLGAAWTLWERRQMDPWLRLLGKAGGKLQKAGLEIPPNTPPRRMAELVLARSKDADKTTGGLHQWLLDMERWRYGAQPASTLRAMQRQFRQLAWPDKLP
jgi:hypothetical protein